MTRTQAAAQQGSFDTLLVAVQGDLPAVLDEVVVLLEPEWPQYAAFLAEERDEVALAGRGALRQIVQTAERAYLAGRTVSAVDAAASDSTVDLELFAELGRSQWRTGASLPALLSAYQVGAQVAWRVLSRTAVRLEVPASCIALLAEAVFALVTTLSAASARGYVEAQSRAVATRERTRGELAELLLSDRSDPELVRTTAARAGWAVPRTAALVLLDADADAARQRLFATEPESLNLHRAGLLGVIVPDPDAPGRRQRLALALRGTRAVIGRSVPPQELPASWIVACRALALRRDGVLQSDPVFVEEHLAALIVHADPRLLAAMRERVLAPLQDAPAETRERLLETLHCWLQQMGNRQLVADSLHVHRQTVRYRLAQLSELFGARLDDPVTRLQLHLALEWREPGVAGPAGEESARSGPSIDSEPARAVSMARDREAAQQRVPLWSPGTEDTHG